MNVEQDEKLYVVFSTIKKGIHQQGYEGDVTYVQWECDRTPPGHPILRQDAAAHLFSRSEAELVSEYLAARLPGRTRPCPMSPVMDVQVAEKPEGPPVVLPGVWLVVLIPIDDLNLTAVGWAKELRPTAVDALSKLPTQLELVRVGNEGEPDADPDGISQLPVS